MADDQTQRPFRSNPMPTRSAPSVAPGTGSSGSDPLAELARLIGQNDPFAEYGRQNKAQRAPAPQPAAAYAQPAASPAYVPPPAAPAPLPEMHPAEYVPAAYEPGYTDQAAGYEQAGYDPNNPHSETEHHDFYDDVPPRRRMGILAIAAVFALAVVGTAGAFGYRALFGSSSPSGPPPVIKADTSPSKIVPANSKDAKNGKLIYDRVADRNQGEKLVSREEQPVDINNKPPGVVMPQDQNGMPSGSIQPGLGSGVVGAEPKKVHTIAIRPDGSAMADAAPNAPAAPLAAPPASQQAQPAQQAHPMAAAPGPAPRQPVARAEAPEHHAAAPAPRNAPLSLNPDASAPARSERPVRTAAVAPPTQIAPTRAAPTATPTAAASGGYAVQLASRHNEADAQSSFHSLQTKYPQQLGGRQPLIRRVDLGTKGVYYRAMVGPFGSSEEASQLCSTIKAAGGSCFVQRI